MFKQCRYEARRCCAARARELPAQIRSDMQVWRCRIVFDILHYYYYAHAALQPAHAREEALLRCANSAICASAAARCGLSRAITPGVVLCLCCVTLRLFSCFCSCRAMRQQLPPRFMSARCAAQRHAPLFCYAAKSAALDVASAKTAAARRAKRCHYCQRQRRKARRLLPRACALC